MDDDQRRKLSYEIITLICKFCETNKINLLEITEDLFAISLTLVTAYQQTIKELTNEGN